MTAKTDDVQKILDAIAQCCADNSITRENAAEKVKTLLRYVLVEIAYYPVDKAPYDMGFDIDDYLVERGVLSYDYVKPEFGELLSCLRKIKDFCDDKSNSFVSYFLGCDIEWISMTYVADEILKADLMSPGRLGFRTTEGYDPKKTVNLAKDAIKKWF